MPTAEANAQKVIQLESALSAPFYCIEREGDSRVFVNSSGAKVQFTTSEKAETVVTIFGNAFTREKELVS